MHDKQENHRMHLHRAPRKPRPQRNIVQRPPVPQPVHHDADEPEGRRDRGAFEVLGFPRLVFGQHGDGDVEACQTCEAAEHEEREQDVVGGGAETETEGGGGGGEAEGYQVCQRIQFLAHQTRLLAPARYFSVHEIEK